MNDIQLFISDKRGVSPIFGILLLVAITLMLAGVLIIVVYSFINIDQRSDDLRSFSVNLDSSMDLITITLMKGDRVSTGNMRILIDEKNVTLEQRILKVGEQVNATSPVDIILGRSYQIKIVIGDSLVFDQERKAN